MSSVAVVTGSSRGIGAAVARVLVERAWRVVGVARSDPPPELRGGPQGAAYDHVALDLADLDATTTAFERLAATNEALRGAERIGLVNNAGILGPMVPTSELPAAELARAHGLNAVTPVWLMGFFLRHRPEIPLTIVNLSSGAATSPYPGWSAYCSSKAALRMAGQVLGRELEETPGLRGREARIVEYAPHVVATAMQAEVRATDIADFPRRQRFVDLLEQGELVDAEGPAREIADLLAAEDLPLHSERRFQP